MLLFPVSHRTGGLREPSFAEICAGHRVRSVVSRVHVHPDVSDEANPADRDLPAGRVSDIRARWVSEWLTTALGKSIVVDNRGGVGGNIGAEAAQSDRLARARADLRPFNRFGEQWRGARWQKMTLKVFKLPSGEGRLRKPYVMRSDAEWSALQPAC